MMGAMQHSYYLRMMLTEMVNQDTFNYDVVNFPRIVGAIKLRKLFNEREVFTGIGLGFQLFSPRPMTDKINDCGTVKKLDEDQ